jgi:hypothetical protein
MSSSESDSDYPAMQMSLPGGSHLVMTPEGSAIACGPAADPVIVLQNMN